MVAAGESLIPAEEAGSDTLSCPNDYLIINGLRLCGDKFNDGSVTSDTTMNAPVTGNKENQTTTKDFKNSPCRYQRWSHRNSSKKRFQRHGTRLQVVLHAEPVSRNATQALDNCSLFINKNNKSDTLRHCFPPSVGRHERSTTHTDISFLPPPSTHTSTIDIPRRLILLFVCLSSLWLRTCRLLKKAPVQIGPVRRRARQGSPSPPLTARMTILAALVAKMDGKDLSTLFIESERTTRSNGKDTTGPKLI